MLTATAAINRRDLDFLLHEWLGLGDLLGRQRFAGHDVATVAAILDLAQEIAKYARDSQFPTLVKPRLGQGAFRLTITDSYERRCAVSGERTLPILDAAHIRAFEAGGEHTPSNGLLLRADIHRLFDLGYVTVSPEGRFEVSSRLKADFDNGRHYCDLQGTTVRSPRDKAAIPSVEALAWHREHRYLGMSASSMTDLSSSIGPRDE